VRNREQVVEEMLFAARPSESDKYLLRLLKADLLQVELLLDIRDLLQRLQPPAIIINTEVNRDDKGLRDQNPRPS
jgi:hypothetical protein